MRFIKNNIFNIIIDLGHRPDQNNSRYLLVVTNKHVFLSSISITNF